MSTGSRSVTFILGLSMSEIATDIVRFAMSGLIPDTLISRDEKRVMGPKDCY